MKGSCAAILAALVAAATSAGEEGGWTFEAFGGSAYNFPVPLLIRQGVDTIEVPSAEYETRAFEGSVYYSWRVGRWRDDDAWEFELLHHKVHLTDNPPGVDHFEVTNGYNLLTLNRAWMRAGFVYRLGAGVVVTHPETTINGLEFDEDGGIVGLGFYISGPTVQAAASRRFDYGGGLFGVLEAKVTVSYAWIPIQDGDADVNVVALHGLFGVGYEF